MDVSDFNKKKILVIRFSSIGDIVLTSPLVRCLKKSGYEVHFLIKEKFLPIIEVHPYIDKIHIFKDIKTSVETIKAEKLDFIVDLQNNRNSRLIGLFSKVQNASFPKLNIQKLFAVWLKWKSLLPNKHIVDRYFEATKKLGIQNDNQGLDFFINTNRISDTIKNIDYPYVVLVVGGSYYTKRIPLSKIKEISHHLSNKKIIVLGDQYDAHTTQTLSSEFDHVLNLCGKTNIHESAYLVKHSEFVITSDTGLMHIAAAFKKKIFSLWGNTIPEFGMYPYMSHPESKIIENKKLWCRPCSKLGYSYCPLGHFSCMRDLDISQIKR